MEAFSITQNLPLTICKNKRPQYERIIDRYFGSKTGQKYSDEELEILMMDGLGTLDSIIRHCISIEAILLKYNQYETCSEKVDSQSSG